MRPGPGGHHGSSSYRSPSAACASRAPWPSYTTRYGATGRLAGREGRTGGSGGMDGGDRTSRVTGHNRGQWGGLGRWDGWTAVDQGAGGRSGADAADGVDGARGGAKGSTGSARTTGQYPESGNRPETRWNRCGGASRSTRGGRRPGKGGTDRRGRGQAGLGAARADWVARADWGRQGATFPVAPAVAEPSPRQARPRGPRGGPWSRCPRGLSGLMAAGAGAGKGSCARKAAVQLGRPTRTPAVSRRSVRPVRRAPC